MLVSLWGPIMMTVMFWQISNEIMSIKEAKKTYILLDMFTGLGLILGGFISPYFFNAETLMPLDPEALTTSVNYSIIFFFISFLAILALYHILSKKIKTKQKLDVSLKAESVTNVAPLSFLKSLIDIFKSPYIWPIVAIMFSNDLTAQLLNLSWKSKMGLYFSGSRGEYNQMIGTLAMTIGYLSICFLPIGYIILARCRWLTAAFIPPILTLFMGLLFFSIILYTDSMDPATPFMGTTLSKVIIWIGYVSGRSQMFLGLFYATLLIAYIPLNENLKTKGRAIVELILAGGIKSLAMFVVNSLIMSTTLTSGMIQFRRFTPAAIILLILMIIIWIFCVRSLGKRFEILGKESEWKCSPRNFS
jgi:AAA family ATP:ADP antiporter